MGSYETITYEKRGRIALVTLNRPEQKNAFNPRMTAELGAVWEDLKYDDGLSCAIVTAAGDKYFCTGADFTDYDKDTRKSEYATRDEGLRTLTSKNCRCWKPVITAVNGMVVGGGFHFLTAGDINLAAENAVFFDTHCDIGLVPVLEPIELARRIPLETVSRLFLLGRKEKMTAERALQVGLVSEVLPQARLLDRAFELGETLASKNLRMLMATVELLYKSREVGTTQAIQQGLQLRELAGWTVTSRLKDK